MGDFDDANCIAWIVVDVVVIVLIGFAVVTAYQWAVSTFGKHEILFAGKVMNSTTLDWPNDRLVLAFLKGNEVGRTTTALGEFKRAKAGVHDGYFLLEVENAYKLDKDILEPLDFERSGAKWWTYFEIEEGDSREFAIPEKNITYEIRVVAGDISTLPAAMLEPGSTHLSETGDLVVQLRPESEAEDDPAVLVQAVQIRSETEELEVNKITVPLNNCGGSASLEQEYIQAQTFYHEYTAEVGGTIGGEVRLPILPVSLLAELESRYGFVDGQTSTREITYRMKAEPGTNQVYVIIWKEVWEKGEADLLANQDLITVPFKVKSNLIYQVDSAKLDCP